MVSASFEWLRHGRWLGVLIACAASSAGAIDQEIRALFTPDPAHPNNNHFVNQTPSTGYCVSRPQDCRASNMFSIRLPLRFQSSQAIEPGAAPRDGAMFKVPAQWRGLTVRHSETGETEKVEVRIAGIGTDYRLSDTAANLTGASGATEGHTLLWHGGPWVYAPTPCTYAGVGLLDAISYRFFWKTPVEAVCARGARFLIPAMIYNTLDFAYELRTPNPLGMSSGLYTGVLIYSIGPNGDFEMGDVMLPNDSNLTLNFVLDVQHTLKVDIPPGGEKIQLAPAGGWQSWLYAGRRPVRLFRDQTFNISASSRFRMQLDCASPQDGKSCALRDAVSGHEVPLNVSVTLPNGLTDAAGLPVNRRPLFRDASGTELFQPDIYVDRKPGTLHFEVPAQEMAEMIHPGQSRRYSGSVTVIWDSEV